MFLLLHRPLVWLTFGLSVLALLPLAGFVQAQPPSRARIGFTGYIPPGNLRPIPPPNPGVLGVNGNIGNIGNTGVNGGNGSNTIPGIPGVSGVNAIMGAGGTFGVFGVTGNFGTSGFLVMGASGPLGHTWKYGI